MSDPSISPARGALAVLVRPRPVWLLLAVSFAIGSVPVLASLPWSFVLGGGTYWSSPPGGPFIEGPFDAAQATIGYLRFQTADWSFPLLRVAELGPEGTSITWLDGVPAVSLLGRFVYLLTGQAVNLLGLYMALCLVLPGVMLALALALLGERHLLAALAAGAMGSAVPFLWFRWGHLGHFSHFLLVAALVLYIAGVRASGPGDARTWRRLGWAWAGLLSVAMLLNIYIAAMAGGVWAAALARRWWRGEAAGRALLAQAVATTLGIGVLALAMGVIGAGAHPFSAGFGRWSLNLAGPFVPQISGLVPGTERFIVGHYSQYEGYAYLGAGNLLLLACAAPVLWRWLRAQGREHWPLLAVLAGSVAFALSHQVYLGPWRVLGVPLPDLVVSGLGIFRSSGRFFWLVGYALILAGLVGVLRGYRPAVAAAILAVACVAQVVDVAPLRAAVAENARSARTVGFDLPWVTARVARADAAVVLPSWSCVERQVRAGALPGWRLEDLHGVDLDVQLAAARLRRPVYSVYHARPTTDCRAEQAMMQAPLRRGAAYFYTTGYRPSAEQLGGRAVAEVCEERRWLLVCQLP